MALSIHTTLRSTTHLPVAPQRQRVLALPGVPPAGLGVVVPVALVHASALLAGSGQTTHLTVLVHWVDDPVDAGIAADGLVLWVDKDDFVVLVRAVLVDPVAVENAQVGAAAADTLLSGRLERTLVLELVDTLVGGLACSMPSAIPSPSAIALPTVSYRMWHPWAPASSCHPSARARGRRRSPAWPCIPGGEPCPGGMGGRRGG